MDLRSLRAYAQLFHAAAKRVGVEAEDFRGAFGTGDDATRVVENGSDVSALDIREWSEFGLSARLAFTRGNRAFGEDERVIW